MFSRTALGEVVVLLRLIRSLPVGLQAPLQINVGAAQHSATAKVEVAALRVGTETTALRSDSCRIREIKIPQRRKTDSVVINPPPTEAEIQDFTLPPIRGDPPPLPVRRQMDTEYVFPAALHFNLFILIP